MTGANRMQGAGAEALADQFEDVLWSIDLNDWRQIEIAGNAVLAAMSQYLRSLAACAQLTVPAPEALADGERASHAAYAQISEAFGKMCTVAATATKHRK